MSNKINLDQFLVQKIEELPEEVDMTLWNSIEKKLPKQNKRKMFIFWTSILILSISLVGYAYLTDKTTSSKISYNKSSELKTKSSKNIKPNTSLKNTQPNLLKYIKPILYTQPKTLKNLLPLINTSNFYSEVKSTPEEQEFLMNLLLPKQRVFEYERTQNYLNKIQMTHVRPNKMNSKPKASLNGGLQLGKLNQQFYLNNSLQTTNLFSPSYGFHLYYIKPVHSKIQLGLGLEFDQYQYQEIKNYNESQTITKLDSYNALDIDINTGKIYTKTIYEKVDSIAVQNFDIERTSKISQISINLNAYVEILKHKKWQLLLGISESFRQQIYIQTQYSYNAAFTGIQNVPFDLYHIKSNFIASGLHLRIENKITNHMGMYFEPTFIYNTSKNKQPIQYQIQAKFGLSYQLKT